MTLTGQLSSRYLMRHEFSVGSPKAIESRAPVGIFSVVFEDDGETGYVYGTRHRVLRAPEVLDALHLYNVSAIRDADLPHVLEVQWSSDGSRAAVFINGHAHAAFAFVERRAGCINGFPPPSPWCRSKHEWDDTLVSFLSSAS
jgi:hypothetical protein